MANINTRNVPDDLYHRVRAAAACGAERLPRGSLERFVIRALRRAVEDPQPGAGLPRLKLCAECFARNAAAASAPRSKVAPKDNYAVNHTAVDANPKAAPVELFSHLLDCGAVAGLLGIDSKDIGQSPILSGENPITAAGLGADGARPPAAVPLVETEGVGVEVHPGLWVGGDGDFVTLPREEDRWSVLSAAKDPWHRQMVGYVTKSAPEGPERLVARRGNHMALNLIDVRELGPGGHHYIPDEVIEAAMGFISERLKAGDRVLVHCNRGQSRAPSLALLWMWREGFLSRECPVPMFAQIYEKFLPSAGLKEYLRLQFAAQGAYSL